MLMREKIKKAFLHWCKINGEEYTGGKIMAEDVRHFLIDGNHGLEKGFYVGLSENDCDGYWNELRDYSGTDTIILDNDAPNEWENLDKLVSYLITS